MEFEYDNSETAEKLVKRTRAFMNEVVIPREREDFLGGGDMTEELITELRAEAKDRCLFAPQIPEEYGGLSLDFNDVLPMFEQAGRSLLGPPALRIDAPDEGNIHTIEMVGTDEQKDEWLVPLVKGEYIGVFDDQAGARRRLESEDDQDDRRKGWRRVDHQWAQVVDESGHRRRYSPRDGSYQ